MFNSQNSIINLLYCIITLQFISTVKFFNVIKIDILVNDWLQEVPSYLVIKIWGSTTILDLFF